MMMKNCGNCNFFGERQHHSIKDAFCRRHAPIVFKGVTGHKEMALTGHLMMLKDVLGAVTAWPRVAETEFCGEWEAAE